MKKNTKLPAKLSLKSLYKNTFEEYSDGIATYTKIVLAVAIPAAIYNGLSLSGSAGDLGITFAIVWSFVFVALISYILNKEKLSGSKIATLYVSSSARILPFIAVSVLLLLAVLPLFLVFVGFLLYLQLGFFNPLLLIPLALVGLSVSAYFLVALSVAQASAVDGSTTLESIKKSFRLTKKKRLKIFLAYLALIILIMLALLGVQSLLSINQSIRENVIIQNLAYLVEACLAVPILVIFQVKLYEALNAKR